MKAVVWKPENTNKHIVKIESTIWPPIGIVAIIFAFLVTLVINGIYFIPRWLTPVASHVNYECVDLKKKVIIPRSIRIYPRINSFTRIDNLELELQRNPKCPIASIKNWQDVDCPECPKEAEINSLEKENTKLNNLLEKRKP